MIEKLRRWGCDTDDAMRRMLDDEEFYRECLLDIPGDPNFDMLGEALRDHDVKKGFDAAHALKGVCANLGLTPMFDAVVKLVEPLRAGEDAELTKEYDELLRTREQLEKILDETK